MTIDEQQKNHQEIKERIKAMTDEQLVDAFNRDVGNPGWVSARAVFLCAIHEQFENRNYDYSEIGDRTGLSLARKIKLIDNKIVVVVEQSPFRPKLLIPLSLPAEEALKITKAYFNLGNK